LVDARSKLAGGILERFLLTEARYHGWCEILFRYQSAAKYNNGINKNPVKGVSHHYKA